VGGATVDAVRPAGTEPFSRSFKGSAVPENPSDQYKHWVVIETGGNQRYIFDSNRLRHMGNGSELVHRSCTCWVKDVCENRPGVEIVQQLSGKAILLVDDAELGRDVVRTISRRALDEAPGLEITGAVGRAFNPGLPWNPDTPIAPPPPELWNPAKVDHVTALHATFAAQRRARAARPAPELRYRGLPWHLPCHETGLPAAAVHVYGSGDVQPVGDGLLARTGDPRQVGRGRMAELLGDLKPPKLINDLGGDGWIGVVHADGNRVGTLMTDFPALVAKALTTKELSLPDHCEYLKNVADELDKATKDAFTAAVKRAAPDPKQILPILVGGDDVTFVCHTDLALPITRVFLEEFAALTRQTTYLSALARANEEPTGGLTAAAGIAYVKRHHPLAYAVKLAEELTRSAKRVTKRNTERNAEGTPPISLSTYDFHVTHESTIKPLSVLRADRTRDQVAGYAGPFVMGDPDSLPVWLRPRHESHFLDTVELLSNRTISAVRAHDLREAFDRGFPAYEQRRAVADKDAGEAHKHLLAVQAMDGERFLLLPDALLLRGVTTRSLTTAEVTGP
jgi:hypothetical protein